MINGYKEMEKSPKLVVTAGESSPPLGTWGILKESSKLTWKNKKLMFSLNLPVLPLYIIIALFNNSVIDFLMRGFDSNVPLLYLEPCNHSISHATLIRIHKDLQILVAVEFGCLAGFWLITLAMMVATIYSSASIYVGVDLTREKILAMIRQVLKRSAITWLFVFLLSVAYVGGASLLVWVVLPESTGIFIRFARLMSLAFVLFHPCLNATLMLSLVISIVEEEDYYGMAALVEAGEIIKGRRIQGFLLSLLLVALAISIFTVTSFIPNVVFEILLVSLACPLKLLAFVAFTVFYYECRKVNGKKVVVRGEVSTAQDSRMNKNDVELNVCRSICIHSTTH